MRDWLHLLGHLPSNNGEPRWFETDSGDKRLAYDRRLIAEKYPDLKYALNWKLQKVTLSGDIVLIEEKSGIPTSLKIKIIFPDNYPKSEPIALDNGNSFPYIADRHFYTTGVCCLWFPIESQWKEKDDDTLLNFVDQVAIFFERQLIYDATGNKVWAWGERPHGNIPALINFLEEELKCNQNTLEAFIPFLTSNFKYHNKFKCPCLNGKKYNKCHKQKIDEIRKKIQKM